MISKQMSALLIVLMLTLLSAKTVKATGDAVDATKAVKPDGDVDIRVVRGEVDIIGWDQPEVRVVGTLDEATKAFIFEVDGDETRIFVRLEENRRTRPLVKTWTIRGLHAGRIRISLKKSFQKR